jgi:hypothetical protein
MPSSAPDAPAPTSAPDSETSGAECANCAAALTGPYCAACGQRDGGGVVPLWQVTNEFLEDLVDLDLRIVHTLPTFFARPGRLTAEYVRGRRTRYIRPLRLYLFASFLLFTVLALTDVGLPFSMRPALSPAAQSKIQAEVDATRAELDALRARIGAGTTSSPADAARADALAATENGLRRAGDVLATLNGTPAAADSAVAAARPAPPSPKLPPLLAEPRAFVRTLIDRAPYLMFVLVPTFAMLLKGLYLRQRRLYLEHLVFALHVHALAFIVFAGSVVLGSFDLGTALHLDWWLALSPFGYLFLAQRHVYGQSVAATARKTVALLLAYGIILVGAVVLLIVASVAWL